MRAIWSQPTGWTHDQGIPDDNCDDDTDNGDAPVTQLSQVEDSLAAEDSLIVVGANDDVDYSRYEEGNGFGVALFNARNTFCELNHHLMLWDVAHL